MTLNEYQELAIVSAVKMKPFDAIIYRTLGLTGEAGEVAEKLKRIIREKNSLISDDDKVEIAKELGDVLWYTQGLAHALGFTLEEIGQMNIQKLTDRKKRGVIKGSGDNR